MISPLASNLNPLDSSSIKDYKSCCARRKDMDFWETFLCKGETQISWQKSITTETISVKCRHQGPNKTLLKARRFFQVCGSISCNFAYGIFPRSFTCEWVKTCSAELKELRQYERWLHMMMVAARPPLRSTEPPTVRPRPLQAMPAQKRRRKKTLNVTTEVSIPGRHILT